MSKRKASKSPAVVAELDGPPEHMREPVMRGLDDVRGDSLLREALVESAKWRDPADTASAMARARGSRSVNGWRSVRTMTKLHGINPREFTAAHLRAANKLLTDYEIGIEGASNGRNYDRVDGAVPGDISAIRLDALRRYREAMEACGVQSARVLGLAIISNLSIVKLAGTLGINKEQAHGRLYGAVERLREHYWPPRGNQTDTDYAALEKIADVDERIGRWRSAP
jgi:hypothetical protein